MGDAYPNQIDQDGVGLPLAFQWPTESELTFYFLFSPALTGSQVNLTHLSPGGSLHVLDSPTASYYRFKTRTTRWQVVENQRRPPPHLLPTPARPTQRS